MYPWLNSGRRRGLVNQPADFGLHRLEPLDPPRAQGVSLNGRKRALASECDYQRVSRQNKILKTNNINGILTELLLT